LAGRSARRVAVRPRRAATRELGRAALERSLLALLRTGVAEPRRSPAALVGSYPTVSPLPRPEGHGGLLSVAPSRGRPRPALASVLPYGVRTFLDVPEGSPRPPGRLLRIDGTAQGRREASHVSTPRFARRSASVFRSLGTCSNLIVPKLSASPRTRRWSGWRCGVFTR